MTSASAISSIVGKTSRKVTAIALPAAALGLTRGPAPWRIAQKRRPSLVPYGTTKREELQSTFR